MDLHLTEALRSFRPPSATAENLPSLYVSARIERAILTALAPADAASPPLLTAAVRHALFPGGARLRPKLCLAVAQACGDPDPKMAEAAAASVEMMHCASLVHDDLPCFDAADTRRGQPTVHRAFGENIAVLAGDHLIVLAFEHLARVGVESPRALAAMVGLLARGVGAPHGIIAGQAWESEERIDAALYRRAKTGALFEAAAALGAASAGASPSAWGRVGARVGEAYQVADDILDVMGDPDRLGKPVGQDAAHGRPNAVVNLGLAGARKLFENLVREAAASIPACADPEPVRAWLDEAERRARGAI
ncbi:MAG: polyprenyl synthetase family protein [Polyangiaceae bacterium]